MIHAIDTETTGLRYSHGDRAFLISYTDEKEQPQVINIGIDDLIPIDLMMMVSTNEWVGHNIAFDLPFLAHFALRPVGPIHDTMIMAHIYNNLEPFKDLATLAEKYCGIKNTEDEALERWFEDQGLTAKDERKYIDVPREIMEPYAKADVARTLALFKFYKEKGILEDSAYKAEMQLLPVVARMGQRGMCIDRDFAKEEMKRATHILSTIEEHARKEHGIDNISSVHEIANALFNDKTGIECITKTDKGNISLDEYSLKKYSHPLVQVVLEHRFIYKMAQTYLKAVIEKSYENRLYTSLRQVGARTGRFSSSDPNLQNIPRSDESQVLNLRRCFTCSPESSLLLIDLSQIELRILAHYSKEPSMIETLKDRKGDIHTTTAIQMFGEVNEELRTVAKTLNFAVIYGAGSAALVEQLNKALPNKKITTQQATDFKQKFFKGYPAVQQFLWDVQRVIAERGYVKGASGKKYYCEKNKAYRASNYLIQGESAMVMKRMMVDVENYLSGRLTQLVNVIHDEFIFDLHQTDTDCIQGLLGVIEQPVGWRVPLYANASISHTNWAEKKKVT